MYQQNKKRINEIHFTNELFTLVKSIWSPTSHSKTFYIHIKYIYLIIQVSNNGILTLILLMWRIWWAPNNASRWQIGFNSAFKGLNLELRDFRTSSFAGNISGTGSISFHRRKGGEAGIHFITTLLSTTGPVNHV